MKFKLVIAGIACVSFYFAACSTQGQVAKAPSPQKQKAATKLPRRAEPDKGSGKIYQGKCSWYSVKTNGGTRTASGERLRDTAFTAAHRTLPFGTRVRVTNKKNGKRVIVRITDRGPFIRGRIIDVSLAAARQIDMIRADVVPAAIEVLKP